MLRYVESGVMRQSYADANSGVKRHSEYLAHLLASTVANLFAMTTQEERRAPGWVPDISTFGARLALVRQAMGWGNVAEAAKMCGVPIASWRNWERDGREPRGLINVAMKIAGVTGVDYRWLALGPDVQQGQPVPAVGMKPTGEYPMRYRPREHVVAIGAGEVRDSNMRSNLRTRPIDGIRPDRTVLR